jgi:predicted alpha/beta-hydrolase family hydrolase
MSNDVAITVKIDAPADPQPQAPLLIMAHGANNDLDFPLLAHLAARLPHLVSASVVRFNFPYVERGVTSPDSRPVLESTFVRVYEEVVGRYGDASRRIFVGGKSLGGRTAAELVSRHAEGSGLEAAGLIILGYPLHAAGHKERLFLDPIRHIDIPSLFCIGSRDPLCDPKLLGPVLAGFRVPGELFVVKDGDHSLHLPRSRGRQPDDSYEPVTLRIADFMRQV